MPPVVFFVPEWVLFEPAAERDRPVRAARAVNPQNFNFAVPMGRMGALRWRRDFVWLPGAPILPADLPVFLREVD